jgi:hypothetical protein
MGNTKGAVQNDRGRLTRIDDAAVKPKVEDSLLGEAKAFFSKIVPDSIENASEDAITKAREFFTNLSPKVKDTTTKESTVLSVDRKNLQAL